MGSCFCPVWCWAALLALSGLRDAKEMYDSTIGRDGHEGVSTFYGYYMLEAMSAANENQRALDTVRDYWGAMLDVGATTFWEDFKLSWTNNCFRIDEMPVEGKADVSVSALRQDAHRPMGWQ